MDDGADANADGEDEGNRSDWERHVDDEDGMDLDYFV